MALSAVIALVALLWPDTDAGLPTASRPTSSSATATAATATSAPPTTVGAPTTVPPAPPPSQPVAADPFEVTPIPQEGLSRGFVVSDGRDIAWVDNAATRVPVVSFATFDDTRRASSDRRGGIVFTDNGTLYWLQPGRELPDVIDWLPVPRFHALDVIDDVALPFSGPLITVLDQTSGVTRVADLGDGGLIPRVDDFLAAVAAGRPLVVSIEETAREPDRDDDSDSSDHTPAFLVVESSDGTGGFRVRMSTDGEPAVWIDDFDGRRVLVTRSPLEPANAPQTSFLIDPTCGWQCTEMYWSPAFADLSIAGPVGDEPRALDDGAWHEFLTCSASGLPTEPKPQPDLPPQVAGKRAELVSSAAACLVPALEFRALSDGTDVLAGFAGGLTTGEAVWSPYATAGGELARLTGTPPLAGLHAALQFPHAVVDRGGLYVWPEIAAPGFDWDGLSDAAAAELSEIYGEELIEGSRSQGEYHSAWWIAIDDTGSWRTIGFTWD